jgi:hypothetical protein
MLTAMAETTTTVQNMRQMAEIVAGVVKDILALEDPDTTLLYANSRLVAWRHILFYKCFENTLVAIPASLPSNWTSAQAAGFFATLTNALETDMAALGDTELVKPVIPTD